MALMLLVIISQFEISSAFGSSWHIECKLNSCRAKFLQMQLKWKAQKSTLNGTLEKVEGLPIDNEEFNIAINKINSSLNLSIPKAQYLNEFIVWLGNIGYSQYKQNIKRYLAAATQTIKIYEQNRTDDYICAFLAYKYPQEISKIDFDINPANKLDETLMFIKYLGYIDNVKNPEERYKEASKAFVYLLQEQNHGTFVESFANYQNFVIDYKASQYYTLLQNYINAQAKNQERFYIYQKLRKELPIVMGSIVLVWILIFGYIAIDKKRKGKKHA
ncbi:hypothetical protein [Desulfurella sp.]|uniref:hypothetical protein n=1 Tax=Desulfurella sp. TaxID=1962857 RepID=UPI003D1039EE